MERNNEIVEENKKGLLHRNKQQTYQQNASLMSHSDFKMPLLMSIIENHQRTLAQYIRLEVNLKKSII